MKCAREVCTPGCDQGDEAVVGWCDLIFVWLHLVASDTLLVGWCQAYIV